MPKFASPSGETRASSDPILPPDEEVTAEYPEPPLEGFSLDEDPTIEREVPASIVAIAATRGDDDFKTELVTFAEILARVGPRHLGGPLPPIRDDLFTTADTPVESPVSTSEVDAQWPDESKTKG